MIDPSKALLRAKTVDEDPHMAARPGTRDDSIVSVVYVWCPAIAISINRCLYLLHPKGIVGTSYAGLLHDANLRNGG